MKCAAQGQAMYSFCPKTGEPLELVKRSAKAWVTVWRSSQWGYLEVADPKWCYPLIPIDDDVLQKVEESSLDVLEQAAKKLRFVDYQTVAIADFESALRGG